jgi:hypothetical protein
VALCELDCLGTKLNKRPQHGAAHIENSHRKSKQRDNDKHHHQQNLPVQTGEFVIDSRPRSYIKQFRKLLDWRHNGGFPGKISLSEQQMDGEFPIRSAVDGKIAMTVVV